MELAKVRISIDDKQVYSILSIEWPRAWFVSITSGAGAVFTENEDISIAGIIRTDGDLSLNAGTNGN